MKNKIKSHYELLEFLTNCSDKEKYIACTTPVIISNIFALSHIMQSIRNDLGTPIIITSGFRDVEHNNRVGGVRNSQHLNGSACDFVCPGVSDYRKLSERIDDLVQYDQMIVYDNFIHLSYNREYNRNQIIHKTKFT